MTKRETLLTTPVAKATIPGRWHIVANRTWGGTNCIESLHGTSKCGHSVIWHDGKTQFHHKVVFVLNKREVAENEVIHHECHNKVCINPDHLTAIDRRTHSIEHNRGEANTRSKLSEAIVRDIRKAWKAGTESYNSLAEKYNVSNGCIAGVVQNRTWKHVK